MPMHNKYQSLALCQDLSRCHSNFIFNVCQETDGYKKLPLYDLVFDI